MYTVHFCKFADAVGTVDKYLVRDDTENYSDILLIRQSVRLPITKVCTEDVFDIAELKNAPIPTYTEP